MAIDLSNITFTSWIWIIASLVILFIILRFFFHIVIHIIQLIFRFFWHALAIAIFLLIIYFILRSLNII